MMPPAGYPSGPPTGARPTSGGRAGTLVLVGIAVLLALLLAVMLTALLLGGRDDGAGRPATDLGATPAAADQNVALGRDRVVRQAQQAAGVLNTLDYQNVAAGLDRWQSVSTGALADEFRANRQTYARSITESRTRTEARTLAAGVSALDVRAGTASVLVAVDVTVLAEGQPPSDRRQRLRLEMTRTDQGWKASAIEPLGQ